MTSSSRVFSVTSLAPRLPSDEERLLELLFDGYNPSARPVINSSHTVDVTMLFSLLQIQELVSTRENRSPSLCVGDAVSLPSQRDTASTPPPRPSVPFETLRSCVLNATREFTGEIYLKSRDVSADSHSYDRSISEKKWVVL